MWLKVELCEGHFAYLNSDDISSLEQHKGTPGSVERYIYNNPWTDIRMKNGHQFLVKEKVTCLMQEIWNAEILNPPSEPQEPSASSSSQETSTPKATIGPAGSAALPG